MFAYSNYGNTGIISLLYVQLGSTEPHQENETRSVSYNGGEKIIVILVLITLS